LPRVVARASLEAEEIANLLIAQGIDPSKMIPTIGPNQDVGSWAGPVNV
jgi:hypothetical protein